MSIVATVGWRLGASGLVALVAAFALACGGAPPPPPMHPEEPAAEEPPEHEPEQIITNTAPTPESQRAPSTASFEEATATPEMLDQHDARAHLTDQQLTNPMRDVPSKCRLPKRAKITVKVAVQNGRAIGVSTNVAWEKPPGKQRPPTPMMVRQENKASAKITTCVDHTVRAIVWPPSSRRDSFTTSF